MEEVGGASSSQGNVAEEVRHRFAVVGSPDGLGQDHGDVDDLRETRPHRYLPPQLSLLAK